MKKQMLALLLSVNAFAINAADEQIEDQTAAYEMETAEQAEVDGVENADVAQVQAEELAPVDAQEDTNSSEEPSFLQKIINMIKNFIAMIVDAFKNLFAGTPHGAQVEVTEEPLAVENDVVVASEAQEVSEVAGDAQEEAEHADHDMQVSFSEARPQISDAVDWAQKNS